ncbi:hypothetical protein JTB14_014120 [Gonioctena quinquepunctata]|nr:hypothetical protein JTB14_014120 [Gonioctena quinquepunctata]
MITDLSEGGGDFSEFEDKLRHNVEESTESKFSPAQTIVKSNAQRQKEYRKRKKIEKQQHSPKKIPKTNAQYQQEFRQKQKKIQLSETLILARKKMNAERSKRYRDKLKSKKQLAELDSLLSSKEGSLPTVLIENKKKTDHRRDTNWEELIFGQFQMQANQIQPSMNNEGQQVISPSFQSFEAPYEEHDECSMPNALLHHETNIAGDP